MTKTWNYTLTYVRGTITKIPNNEVQTFIKLFTDIFLMEYLPKKIILYKNNKGTKRCLIRFLSKKFPKPLKTIEYVPDLIYRQLEDIGFKIPFWWITKFGFINKQKERKNKFILLDIKR